MYDEFTKWSFRHSGRTYRSGSSYGSTIELNIDGGGFLSAGYHGKAMSEWSRRNHGAYYSLVARYIRPHVNERKVGTWEVGEIDPYANDMGRDAEDWSSIEFDRLGHLYNVFLTHVL